MPCDTSPVSVTIALVVYLRIFFCFFKNDHNKLEVSYSNMWAVTSLPPTVSLAIPST